MEELWGFAHSGADKAVSNAPKIGQIGTHLKIPICGLWIQRALNCDVNSGLRDVPPPVIRPEPAIAADKFEHQLFEPIVVVLNSRRPTGKNRGRGVVCITVRW
jgi:hypothetical protein